MSFSTVTFDRWKPREKSTWPFQVFQKYNLELDNIFWSHIVASKYVYTSLGQKSAQWEDPVQKHFVFEPTQRSKLFKDLRSWSDSFNQFGNWVRLNTLIAATSSLETYLASAITLAIESDPGVLLGATKTVDGVTLLKRGTAKLAIDDHVVACTKGDWSSRIAAYERLFVNAPSILRKKLADLDGIRVLRNKVGHAFGRDIEQARKHGVKEILPMESITLERTLRYQRIIWSTAKSIDVHLLNKHIGEYQALRFYHELYPKLNKSVHPNQRAVFLKKELGHFKAVSPGKIFCNGLVMYYESL